MNDNDNDQQTPETSQNPTDKVVLTDTLLIDLMKGTEVVQSGNESLINDFADMMKKKGFYR